jgi:lipoprotein-anchoring transpeptidase ErfK/SrfK
LKSWLSSKSTPRLALIFASTFLVLALIGLLGFLFVQDVTRWGKFPPGSKICDVSVAGLSKQDAAKKCKAELQGIEQKPVVLTLDGQDYSATPDQLGLHLDYTRMVDGAYSAAWSPGVLERMYRSFVNRPKTVNGLLAVQNNDALVNQFIQRVTGEVNKPPINAYVNVTNGAPVIVKARSGYQVSAEEIRKEVGQAVDSRSRTVAIQAAKTPPQIGDDIFHKLIIINLAQHMLTLYDRETPLAQFPIACGQPAYPTPVGQWEIIGKQMNPTWYNPGSAWAKTMPKSIPPGYNNPLGLRAMPLNASGVLIHGTANDGSIGTSASHGCIRMHMPDAIKLFDMVAVGTPVYIVRGVGDPGFDVTATPKWRLAQNAAKPPATYTGD